MWLQLQCVYLCEKVGRAMAKYVLVRSVADAFNIILKCLKITQNINLFKQKTNLTC